MCHSCERQQLFIHILHNLLSVCLRLPTNKRVRREAMNEREHQGIRNNPTALYPCFWGIPCSSLRSPSSFSESVVLPPLVPFPLPYCAKWPMTRPSLPRIRLQILRSAPGMPTTPPHSPPHVPTLIPVPLICYLEKAPLRPPGPRAEAQPRVALARERLGAPDKTSSLLVNRSWSRAWKEV